MRLRTIAYCLALAAIAAGAWIGALHAMTRVETALAIKCARTSDGTDSAIADCFEHYSLPYPEELK